MKTNGFASDLKEMMTAWNRLQTAARTLLPNASEAEIYQLTSGAMSYSLKLERR